MPRWNPDIACIIIGPITNPLWTQLGLPRWDLVDAFGHVLVWPSWVPIWDPVCSPFVSSVSQLGNVGWDLMLGWRHLVEDFSHVRMVLGKKKFLKVEVVAFFRTLFVASEANSIISFNLYIRTWEVVMATISWTTLYNRVCLISLRLSAGQISSFIIPVSLCS